jgi:FKBP-type peptidyl-prolyl cis-trans isomerase FkpA
MTSINKLAIFLLFLSFYSCKKETTRFTKSGMKYDLYIDKTGTMPALYDYVTFDMVFKTSGDSVLFDSRKNHKPIRIQLNNIPFAGSMEEGLTYLSEGDSATFYISADSLRNHLAGESDPGKMSTSVLVPGSFVKFDIRLIKVQTPTAAEKEIMLKKVERKNIELASIKDYVERHQVKETPDSFGIYIIGAERQQNKIVEGDTVAVYYESKYINGIPYESNKNTNKPFYFVMGSHHVIRGWETAFAQLSLHSRATLLIPSSMAYGEEGLLNSTTGSYIVPPYSPLLFDVEVTGINNYHARK